MYKIVFLDKATDETNDAINWYEERQAGLGKRFLLEIQQCLDSIRKQPDRYAESVEGYRQVHTKKFPYLVVYQIVESKKVIQIVSVFHTKRNPQNKYRL